MSDYFDEQYFGAYFATDTGEPQYGARGKRAIVMPPPIMAPSDDDAWTLFLID